VVFWRIVISTNFRHNEQIRISPIFLINERDEKVGSVSTSEALKMAREAGLDLVEVAPTARPPVCKILDYGKWRYQQQKKSRQIPVCRARRTTQRIETEDGEDRGS
jgi:translation initiation factor IF-3